MDHDRHLTKEDMQRENKHMKRCFMSDVIREIQIKSSAQCQFNSNFPVNEMIIATILKSLGDGETRE